MVLRRGSIAVEPITGSGGGNFTYLMLTDVTWDVVRMDNLHNDMKDEDGHNDASEQMKEKNKMMGKFKLKGENDYGKRANSFCGENEHFKLWLRVSWHSKKMLLNWAMCKSTFFYYFIRMFL